MMLSCKILFQHVIFSALYSTSNYEIIPNMKVFHSVRARIILISTLLLVFFLIVYTVTVWTIANSYALVNTSQNNSFSLSLLANEISNDLDDVRALATRVSIDNELKYYLGYSSANLNSYYDSFENMIQSNPAYSVIDRFIVADSSYSHFLQTGGTTLSYGQPLRSDYFLQEIAHIEEESSYSGIFFSDLAYRSYQVIGYMMPIIDFNNGLTIGYVYASVNIDALLKNLYSYQELNNADLFIRFSGTNYEIKDGALYATSSQPKLEIEPILRNETSKVFKSNTGRYILSIENEKNNFAVTLVFDSPSLIGSSNTAPLLFLAILIGSAIILITVILSIYLDKAIYIPVKKLSKRIEKIQESDFSLDDTINTNDEFGIIGRGINKLSSEVTDLMERRLEDERKKLELEYRMLSSQINPHFLYNTFNSIKWMAKIQKADGISEMITSLSRIMKNISKRDATQVTLKEELSFLDDYFIIMKYRYGNTISYYSHIDESCESIMLPRFCLQPLVENAIFHGIEPKGTGSVAIIAGEFASHYTLMVADNGVGFNTAKTSQSGDGMFKNIGLENIRQRLRHTYGDDASFEISSTEGIGTVCLIRIRKNRGGESEA